MSLDYVLITDPEDLVDIRAILNKIKRYCQPHTRVVFGYYNFLWSPAVRFARRVMYGKSSQLSNWIGEGDVTAFLELSGFETLSTDRVILCPIRIPLLGRILNSYLARFPGIDLLTVYRITSARPFQTSGGHYSVSIILPCKDEAGNVFPAVMRMPELGFRTDIIFFDAQPIAGTAEPVPQPIPPPPITYPHTTSQHSTLHDITRNLCAYVCLHVCMYVCMYVCVYVCIYIYISLSLSLPPSLSLSLSLSLSISLSLYVFNVTSRI